MIEEKIMENSETQESEVVAPKKSAKKSTTPRKSTAKKIEDSKFLTYKNKPLVRCGNSIYYGSPTDKYVALLQVLSTESKMGKEIAKTVSIQLIATDTTINPIERIKKRAEKEGIFPALQIASIWLERELGE